MIIKGKEYKEIIEVFIVKRLVNKFWGNNV